MNRFQNTLRHTMAAMLIAAGTFALTGCTSVATQQVDPATGQVVNVNRHQFILKSLVNGRSRGATTPAQASMTQGNQYAPPQYMTQQPAPAQQYAPQQMSPQYPAQPTSVAPVNAPMNANSPQARMFGIR